jgi:2-oxoisovalerate dehydrogenase E1 component
MPTPDIQLKAYRHMCLAKSMSEMYEQNRTVCKYVHSTSRGHEAIQLATAFQLLPQDYVSPYYRDESLLLGLGFTPYTLMLQLLAKGDDPFSAGREYYAHPSFRGPGVPTIIHQSSATGMQAIPTTGIAQGLKFLQEHPLDPSIANDKQLPPLVICSLGDASITEGEVSEAFQFAVLKKLPIIYLIQDNGWGISVTAKEARTMDAFEFAAGFTGMNRVRVDGSDFDAAYHCMNDVICQVRSGSGPWIVQASVPLLGHHTSGVRKEFYRDDAELAMAAKDDPGFKLKQKLLDIGISPDHLEQVEKRALEEIQSAFNSAVESPDPNPDTISEHIFRETPVKIESGNRNENGLGKIMMVDAALFAIREIMEDFPEAVLYGQDVGGRLGGVFREAATLATQFGDHRVFNTAIQEAYIIGSTAGMSAVGLKPIVEIQFADYIYPGINQLVTELSKSCYLSAGKFPVQVVIRVPIGAYGGGGPYHSGSIESTLLTIKGIKVVYPSNAADMKGLMKAAFLDPNPVVMLEHKGLYWSKVPGTEDARRPEPAKDYIIPLGKAIQVLKADTKKTAEGRTCCIITYGMGVYWARKAEIFFPGQVEIIDLRTLFPLDEELIFETVKTHGKCLVLTEDTQHNSFAEALAGRISHQCFRFLDAPVEVIGSLDLPAVPMNVKLEEAMLPNPVKINSVIRMLLED